MASPFPQSHQTLRQRQPKTGSFGSVFGIADASTTICTRPNSRAAPLCPNLHCNLWPTLTARSEPLPFSELAETRVQASNQYLDFFVWYGIHTASVPSAAEIHTGGGAVLGKPKGSPARRHSRKIDVK